jgi:hypothetical protein
MIGLVLAQLAARWGQAVTLFALSLAATVAAVSAPVYAVAVDREATANELAAADPVQLVAAVPVIGQEWQDPPAGDLDGPAAVLALLTDFTPVTTVEIRVQGLRGEDAPASESHRMIARDGFCRYVVFQSGRCPVGSREAALPASVADPAALGPGDQPVLTPVVRSDTGLVPDGPPVAITIVGVFEARDPTEPYWASMDPLGTRGLGSGVFTNRTALQSLAHGEERVALDAVLPPGRLTADRIPQLRQQLEAADRRLLSEGAGPGGLVTDLPTVLDRIASHGEQARALLPIAAAPLVALCWFVVYLAVGHGVAGRRHEFGVVALRGAKPRTRAVAVATESLLPVLAGLPAGLAVVPALVGLAVPGTPYQLTVDSGQAPAAGLAAAGTVVAVLLALWRELAAPVVQLLRRVPPRRRRAAAAAEVLAVVLAIAVVADLRGLDGELVGVMVAAPAVVILAVAVLAARAARPLIDLAGRWSLRRGWLGPAMAALYLARRPGAARLVLVLALVLGTLGFAAASADVAAEGRIAEARWQLGAARVLQVQEISRSGLLTKVRAADPEGRYAMAVTSAPAGNPGDPSVLAVDATRLPAVSLWAGWYGDRGPAEVAELLRPPAPEPVLVTDGELTAELSPDQFTEDDTTSVSLLLAPVAGGPPGQVRFGTAGADQRVHEATVSGCPDGCRLTGLAVSTTAVGDELFGVPTRVARVGVILHTLQQAGQELGPAGWLTDPARWRSPEEGLPADHLRAEVEAGGLLLTKPGPEPDRPYELFAVDAPFPLPVVVTGALPDRERLVGLDNLQLQIAPQADVAGLPGVGADGALMDLEYAERLAVEPGGARSPQVWLAADAPPEIVDRLVEQGLVISGDRTVDQQRQVTDESGAALALRFYLLAGGVAVLVGLGALVLVTAVDRRTWRRGLQELRAQGLADRTTTAAALWSYGGMVVAGGVAGALAAAVAWLAAGELLPLGVNELALPSWPQWTRTLALWSVAMAVLLAAAVAAAWWQRRARQEVSA